MADTTWYVDFTLTTGNNDGTDWDNAYRSGVTGANSLQTAIDKANDADNTTVYVRTDEDWLGRCGRWQSLCHLRDTG